MTASAASQHLDTASEQFYKICKKCNDEHLKEDELVGLLHALIQQHGVASIDINYRHERGDFALKYVFKYTRPKVLQFILQQFEANTLDLYLIDNIQLRNNVLHYMIYAMGGCDEKAASRIVDIVYGEQYADQLDAYGLLYQFNEFLDTPITYSRKRKFVELSTRLEKIKYVHIHELLIAQCGIPYELSHCIISYVFVVIYAKDLPDLSQMSARNAYNIILSPDSKQ